MVRKRTPSQIRMHNRLMEENIFFLKMERDVNPTKAELVFSDMAKSRGILLEKEYTIRIYDKDGYMLKFYFADFCDVQNNIIFEIDGGYHNTKSQKKLDNRRTKDLKALGYKVYRITNDEVFDKGIEKLLYTAYKNL